MDRIAARLDSITNYRASFSYSVTLPITDSDIEYRARLDYRREPADTLCGYSYLVDYKAENDTCPYSNFAAYSQGDCFRFDRNRLREYHNESTGCANTTTRATPSPLPGTGTTPGFIARGSSPNSFRPRLPANCGSTGNGPTAGYSFSPTRSCRVLAAMPYS